MALLLVQRAVRREVPQAEPGVYDGGASPSGGASDGGDSGGQSTCVEGGSGAAGWSPSDDGGGGASTSSNTSLQQYVRACRTPSVSSVSPFGKSIGCLVRARAPAFW